MTTVIEFRARRSDTDAARSRAADPRLPLSASADPLRDAEIILFPLSWLKRLRRDAPRKTLRRRFTLDGAFPAPA